MTNKSNFINGNTVIRPEYSPEETDNRQYEEYKKAKEKVLTKNKKRQIRNKLCILRNIVVIFILGLTVIGRYVAIYKMEANLSDIKSQIVKLNNDNESLKIQLVKYGNIKNIEDVAAKKLHMISCDRSSAINVNLDKNNFTKAVKEDIKPKKIWDIIKSNLF